jgi:hypothetical protein
MRFLLGQTNSIRKATFSRLKWLLSGLSVALTSGFVLLLQAHA